MYVCMYVCLSDLCVFLHIMFWTACDQNADCFVVDFYGNYKHRNFLIQE